MVRDQGVIDVVHELPNSHADYVDALDELIPLDEQAFEADEANPGGGKRSPVLRLRMSSGTVWEADQIDLSFFDDVNRWVVHQAEWYVPGEKYVYESTAPAYARSYGLEYGSRKLTRVERPMAKRSSGAGERLHLVWAHEIEQPSRNQTSLARWEYLYAYEIEYDADLKYGAAAVFATELEGTVARGDYVLHDDLTCQTQLPMHLRPTGLSYLDWHVSQRETENRAQIVEWNLAQLLAGDGNTGSEKPFATWNSHGWVSAYQRDGWKWLSATRSGRLLVHNVQGVL
jgi:hypothetical protein